MLSNHFTLIQVARLIHHRCSGHKIAEVFSQHKAQLCITVESEPLQTIVISCEPSENYLFVRAGDVRARRNSVDLFPSVIGKTILSVACNPDDRVVVMNLEEGYALESEMFGSRANVLLWKEKSGEVSPGGVVADAFLNKKELIVTRRKPKREPSSPAYQRLAADEQLFLETLRSANEEGIFHALKKTIPSLGSELAREVLTRAGVDPSQSPSTSADRDLRKVFNETASVVAAASAKDAQARIYFDGESPVTLALLPLRSMDQYRHESFSDIGVAIQRFVGMSRAASTFKEERVLISSWLEKEEKKVTQTLTKMAAEQSNHDRAGEYELSGKLIMAHIHELRKGTRSAPLTNTLTGEGAPGVVTVSLDPSLTPAANAEKYFEKAKKARAAVDDSSVRAKSLEQRLLKLQMLSEELAEIQSNESLKLFQQRSKEALSAIGYLTTKEKESLPPFRIFNVVGGFQVLAGKSSENNDMLTTKYAKPHDLWFHCRGSSGSHVVLKVNSAEGEPSKTAIHQAASIAAYYSKMKNASSVPVAMTEKKFVRKPKGAPAGTVVLEREKVIFVEPKLPSPTHHS